MRTMMKGYNMKPKKHGNKWEVQYRVPGYEKPFKERYENEEEANLRCAEIEFNKRRGTLAPPVKKQKLHPPTVSELLDDFVRIYGTSHWGDSYYSMTVHRISSGERPYPAAA